jgi:hypothetical protein
VYGLPPVNTPDKDRGKDEEVLEPQQREVRAGASQYLVVILHRQWVTVVNRCTNLEGEQNENYCTCRYMNHYSYKSTNPYCKQRLFLILV